MPSLDIYEQTAIALAHDPVRLTELRQRIAANRTSAPLFDTPRFARSLERAYDTMRRQKLAGGPAAPIVVREESRNE